MDKGSYLELVDGTKIDINQYFQQIPQNIMTSILHAEVCNVLSFLKSQYLSNEEERKVYTNLLHLKSHDTKQISAILYSIHHGVIQVKTIVSNIIPKEVLDLIVCPNKIEVHGVLDINHSYINSSVSKTLLLKAIINNIYRLLGFFYTSKKTKAIRTWVELSTALFPNEFTQSSILVYPFTLNIKRHIHFIRGLISDGRDWSFAGLPYSIWLALHILVLKPKDRDICIARFEYKANRQHGKEILTKYKKLKCLYTSDEFEVASIAIHSAITHKSVEVHDTTHGLGFYGPYVQYTSMKVMNIAQHNFYIKYNPHISFSGGARISCKDIPHTPQYEQPSTPVIVFIHSRCKHVSLQYEGTVEDRAVLKIKSISLALNIPFVIKKHPNSTEKVQTELLAYDIPLITNLDSIKKQSPIFVTLLSTSFYDFCHLGPFLFIKDGLFDPYPYFGHAINISSLDMLENAIRQLITDENIYSNHVKDQINSWQKAMMLKGLAI